MKTYLRKYPRDAAFLLLFVITVVFSANTLSMEKRGILFLAGLSWSVGYYLLGRSWEPPGFQRLRILAFFVMLGGGSFFIWLFTQIE